MNKPWEITITTTFNGDPARVEVRRMLKRHNEIISDIGMALRRPILKQNNLKKIEIVITPPEEE